MKVELRAMTNSLGILESPVMIFSVMPSLKYSCSFSPLMFVNGSTAIEGLSGSGYAIFLTEATSIAGLAGETVVEGLALDGETFFSSRGIALGVGVSG